MLETTEIPENKVSVSMLVCVKSMAQNLSHILQSCSEKTKNRKVLLPIVGYFSEDSRNQLNTSRRCRGEFLSERGIQYFVLPLQSSSTYPSWMCKILVMITKYRY